MKHYDVVIATPGKIFTEHYVVSIIKTISELNAKNISWYWVNSYNPHLGASREFTMVENGLTDYISYDKIFWIDSDISWEPENFFRLYSSDKEIICGAYILNPESLNTTYENYPISIMKDWHPSLNGNKTYRNKIKDIKNFNDLTEINETGFGFICIKKEVFDNIEQPFFSSINVENIHIFSEDTAWCYKAKKFGYQIYFDKRVLVGHSKNVFLSWRVNE